MESSKLFLPLVGEGLDLLPVFTYYILMITSFGFVASFFFSWFTRTHVAPEHNTSRVLTAIICAVAAISYFTISMHYKTYLNELSTGNASDFSDPYRAFVGIGQYGYMDWLITTPLLLIKMLSVLRINFKKAKNLLFCMLFGDVFMIITGFIGEQQFSADGNLLVSAHMIWGAISTVGYIVVLYALYTIWKDQKDNALPEERKAFKLMALTTVTFWGVYPLGYILEAVVPSLDPNWLHIAYSVADLINKAGIGIIAYLVGADLLSKRIDVRSKEFAKHVG
ncbi:MAG: bacteriorhodopsin [Leeuwenhoekiella sp.]